jgi:TatA/E family protein of Tat protein translocase
MNFLGMGPLELVLIVVLALIVFGPAKLPEIMGQVGKAIGDFRRATSELSDEFNRTIQSELNETRQTIEETKSALSDVRSAVDASVSETRAAVSGLPAPQRVAAPTLETPIANGTSHDDNGANGTAVEAATPLADTTQWSWETSPAPAPDPAPVESESPPVAAEASEADPAAEPSAEGSSPSKEHIARDELQPPY